MEPHSCKKDAAVRKVEGGGASPPAAWQRLWELHSREYMNRYLMKMYNTNKDANN